MVTMTSITTVMSNDQ